MSEEEKRQTNTKVDFIGTLLCSQNQLCVISVPVIAIQSWFIHVLCRPVTQWFKASAPTQILLLLQFRR